MLDIPGRSEQNVERPCHVVSDWRSPVLCVRFVVIVIIILVYLSSVQSAVKRFGGKTTTNN